MPKKGKKKLVIDNWTKIGSIAGVVALIIMIIFGINAWKPAPLSNLEFLVHTSTTDIIYSDNTNTTVTGFNVTFSSWVTNKGNIPVHIIAFDIFPKDDIPTDSSYPFTDIRYLQPNESFDYNHTKLFHVTIPASTGTMQQYVGAVVYRDIDGNVKFVLQDLWNLLD